jgi:hypothetical protein
MAYNFIVVTEWLLHFSSLGEMGGLLHFPLLFQNKLLDKFMFLDVALERLLRKKRLSVIFSSTLKF